ncbi:MAG: flagellar motor switch protein FliG [Desulfobacterales bacterium]|nr:flagellar motor switch protein FliG [Desulfobacterales bacterium]
MAEPLDPKKITGPQKAAIFLMMMGEEYTAQVIEKLDEDEVGKLALHMSEIKYIAPDVLGRVMKEYVDEVETDRLMIEGEAFLKALIDSGLDREKANAIYREIEKSRKNIPFSYLEGMDSNTLISFMKGEHPQTIALILSHLRSQRAAEILGGLPRDIQPVVAVRIAEISQVPAEVVTELDQTLQRELFSLGDSRSRRKIGGVSVLADILNEVDRDTEQNVLSSIEEERSEMADEIRQMMFVFEDLVKVDNRGMREILKQVDSQQLCLALKTASEEMKEKVFSNLSERAAEMLREDMEVMGPVRLSEVERAQQGVIRVSRELEAAGKVILSKGKEDVFV